VKACLFTALLLLVSSPVTVCEIVASLAERYGITFAGFYKPLLEPVGTTVAEFAATIRSDTERLAKIVKQAGIRPE
jgi:hypothetical protein